MEPVSDPVHRATLRMAFAALWGGGGLAIAGLIVSGPPLRPAAHARSMVLGFCALFVLAFLARIVPRAVGAPLAAPSWAVRGAAALLLAAVADALGAAEGPMGRAALAGCWGFGGAAWLVALGGTWRAGTPARAWFGGFVAGGGLVLCGVLIAAGVSAAGAWMGPLARAPLAALVGGLTPIAAGLSVKMLPPLAGVGPSDRGLATVPARVVGLAGGGAAIGILAEAHWLAALGVGALLALALRALSAMAWLRLRMDGGAAVHLARMGSDARRMRIGARLAWASLPPGLALVAMGEGFAALGGDGVAWTVAGAHTLGLGFLVSLMAVVSERILPAFVRGGLRWPALRGAPGLLCAAALCARLAASHTPRPRLVLALALLLLLAGMALLQAQVGRSVRSPGTKARSGSDGDGSG